MRGADLDRRFALLAVAAMAIGLLLVACTGSTNASSATGAQPGSSSPSSQSNGNGQNGGNRAGQGTAAAGQRPAPVFGSIASVDGNTLTVTTQQGDTKVNVAAARIQKTVDGTVADLKAGEMVVASGQQGSDGNFVASSLQVRPAGNADQGRFQGQGQRQGQGQGQPQAQNQGQGQGQPQWQNQGQGSRPLSGSVVSVEGDTLTLKNQQGNTTKVILTGAKIETTIDGTISDLKAGETVIVTGQQGPDGSFTAADIQIRPAGTPFAGPARGGGPAASPTATAATN